MVHHYAVMRNFWTMHSEILQSGPIFNQKSNGKVLMSEKRPLGGHIGGQRSIWSKIDNGRKVPPWKLVTPAMHLRQNKCYFEEPLRVKLAAKAYENSLFNY
jgi:hypothetical protein